MEMSGDLVQRPTGEICVYTVLIGHYERLNEQPVSAKSSLSFICLTDDPELRSDSWECRLVAPLFPMDPIRSQRDLKIRPHVHLPEFDGSLYIDSSVILKAPPERFLELPGADTGFLLPRHSFRDTVLDEFLAVSQSGFDDDVRIFEQLNHYSLASPEVLYERPWWTAILLRDHRSARVRAMSEVWASHVKRYSRRDQLSVNLAFQVAGFQPAAIEIDNAASELHSWPHTLDRDRQRGPRNLANSLMPGRALIRQLELQLDAAQRALAERDGQLAAARTTQAERDQQFEATQRALAQRDDEIELARATFAERDRQAELAQTALDAVFRSRSWRITSPIRWISSRLVHRPPHLPISQTEDAAPTREIVDAGGGQDPVPIPDKVRARTGAYIYLDPNDTRGHRLIETNGDLNPPSLKAWQLLLAEHDWTLVVDVGANYGEMLVNGGVPATARVIAVEPNATIRERLRRTLSEAGVKAEVIGAGLSDVQGEGRLLLTPPYSGTTRLAQSDEPSDVHVDLTTLGAILKRVGTPLSEMNVVVKIDVEGHETAVLRGVLPELSGLGRFAALVETLHLSPGDLTWIEERFDLRLLELGDGGGLSPVPPGGLADMLGSGRYYPQDVVLMPKSDLPAT